MNFLRNCRNGVRLCSAQRSFQSVLCQYFQTEETLLWNVAKTVQGSARQKWYHSWPWRLENMSYKVPYLALLLSLSIHAVFKFAKSRLMISKSSYCWATDSALESCSISENHLNCSVSLFSELFFKLPLSIFLCQYNSTIYESVIIVVFCSGGVSHTASYKWKSSFHEFLTGWEMVSALVPFFFSSKCKAKLFWVSWYQDYRLLSSKIRETIRWNAWFRRFRGLQVWDLQLIFTTGKCCFILDIWKSQSKGAYSWFWRWSY